MSSKRDAKGRGLSRRGLFKAGAASGAAAAGIAATGATGAAASAPGTRTATRTADVAIVGGGLSGLAAATELVKLGRSVVLLEANDRVGGRTLSERLPDDSWYVEHGGVFILDEAKERELMALADSVGVGRIRERPQGNAIYHRNGQRVLYDRNGPGGRAPAPPLAIPDLILFNERLNAMKDQVPPDKPWTAAEAPAWDGQTFATFRHDNTTNSEARWAIDIILQALTGNEARDISLLHLLTLMSGSEGMSVRDIVEAAGLYRFDGGSHSISVRLAERLGDRVVLRSPVRRIEQDASGVRVHSDRMRVDAKHVIAAIPPFLTSRILWEPQLPAQRAQLSQRMPNASIFRLSIVYDEPFWRGEGLSGEAWTDFEPMRFAWDVSPPDERLGIFTAFINGAAARRWTRVPAPERKQAVLDNLRTLFGERAAHPKHYYEHGWPYEEWAASCQYGIFPPGVLSDFGESLREPFGRVLWAGTEVAEQWAASMEGAVRSGQKAARQAAEAL